MGPLSGVRVLEIGGIGPVPMCGLILADLGAEVTRIERVGEADLGIAVPVAFDVTKRGRRSIVLDLKSAEGVSVVKTLLAGTDVLLEGFRPGVLERLGLSPESCLEVNPRLIYGRMTGWGQQGPLSQTAGHDPNYVALSGALAMLGSRQMPAIPLSLLGDFAGGALYLAVGVLSGVIEARKSGRGQVVDAAIVDGVSHLLSGFFGLMQAKMWRLERESNFIDGGAHYFRAYETRDGKHVVVAAIERRFYQTMLEILGLDPAEFRHQHDPRAWPSYTQRMRAVFLTKTRDGWCEAFAGRDACFAPVLTMEEAMQHEHARAREAFIDVGGVMQPAPAPRFSRTPGAVRSPPCAAGLHTIEVLQEAGLTEEEISRLLQSGIAEQARSV
jgi:alpha-methylacyl-CoA racemase